MQVKTYQTNDGYVTVDAFRLVAVDDQGNKKQQIKIEKQPAQLKQINLTLKSLRQQLTSLKKNAPPQPPNIMVITDEEKPGDGHLLIRGNVHKEGMQIPRGFLSVATYSRQPPLPANQSGRLELANWISNSKNPLTARVKVNRIWYYLFGTGLVRTVDNFGVMGERPSHPELLDYLAWQFTQQGWSVKELIREIVLSRTYQLSSKVNNKQRTIDPENRLLSHQNHRRLDAEAIRDALLSVSGQLQLSTSKHKEFLKKATPKMSDDIAVVSRSIYLTVDRNQLSDFLAIFDFPDPNLSMGQRNVSTISTQALFMMNSPFIVKQAELTAARLIKLEPTNEEKRIEKLFLLTLGRIPKVKEKSEIQQFLTLLKQQKKTDQEAWGTVCQTLFACIDFRYLP